MKFGRLFSIILAGSFVATASFAAQDITTKQFVDASHDFFFSDFGAINKHSLATGANSIPKQVALTALVLEGRRKGWIDENSRDYKTVLARFGFFTPSSVLNAPVEFKPKWDDLPMGLTEGDIEMGLGIKVRAMNISCSVCHAGRLYDEHGTPTSQTWMGLPNTSINLEGYSQAIYQGMRIISNNMGGTFRLMTNMFPEMSFKEKLVMKVAIFPQIKKTIRHMEDNWKQPMPFKNGPPGTANGLAALKFQLGLMDTSKVQEEYGFSAIPALGDRFFRSSLLWDGVYASPNMERNAERSSWTEQDENFLNAVSALFTIPTMGQSPEGALAAIPRVQKAMNVIFTKYEAPAFPGELDIEKARRGYDVFDNNCAQCHGTYEWRGNSVKLVSFPNRMVPQERMETDPVRWQSVTEELSATFNKTAMSKAAVVARAKGYTAPLLNSLWATAPYLHNGSVPTLWDMMHPETRPAKFMMGGHSLDYQRMGIRLIPNLQTGVWEYPSDVSPTSTPVVYDTSLPGQSNKGHTRPFAKLTEDEKSDLMEYLKLL